MKQVFVLALLSVWMFSCNEVAETRTDSVQTDSVKTDSALIDSAKLKVADTIGKIDTVPAEPTYATSFNVTFTSSYCGGARPTEEILAEKGTPKPLSLSTVQLINHFSGKEYLLKTNAEGIATAQMEEGKYDVFLTRDINEKLGTGFDGKCNLWLKQLLLTVKVTSAGNSQNVNIHFTCNPCDSEVKKRR